MLFVCGVRLKACACFVCFSQKTGNAIRALGRMATLSASRRNSAGTAASAPSSPRPSIASNANAACNRMSSVNEEDAEDTATSRRENFNNEINAHQRTYTGSVSGKILKEICDLGETKKKLYRTRSCSERSDSGISDCSNHATTASSSGGSCTSTPLLGKKFCINEEPEYERRLGAGENVEEIVERPDFSNRKTSGDCRVENSTKPLLKDELKVDNKTLLVDALEQKKNCETLISLNNDNKNQVRVEDATVKETTPTRSQPEGKFCVFIDLTTLGLKR